MTRRPVCRRESCKVLGPACVAIVALLLAIALWPAAVPVDVTRRASTRGPLQVTIDEEGETRVRDRFVVSAPVAGRVLRIELEPGDPVGAATPWSRVHAGRGPSLLDRPLARGG